MPTLSPARPTSPSFTRASRIALVGLATLGVVLGVWEAKDCAAIQFGYVAGYAYATAIFLGIILCGIGLLLLVYWRTRNIGVGFVAAGILSCVTFYGGMAMLLRFDRVAWRHEPPLVAFGPEQKASLVIYFRHETSDAQVEEFSSSVLTEAGQLPAFVRSYLRLLPSQANGHEGVALTFNEKAPPEQVAKYIEKIKRDSRVDAVYEDTAPTAIEATPNRTRGTANPK